MQVQEVEGMQEHLRGPSQGCRGLGEQLGDTGLFGFYRDSPAEKAEGNCPRVPE